MFRVVALVSYSSLTGALKGLVLDVSVMSLVLVLSGKCRCLGLIWRVFVMVYMTVSQTDVHSERIDEPALPEVWLRDVETACYSSVLRR